VIINKDQHFNRCCNSCRQKCDQEKAEKILKYEPLTIVIQLMRNVNAEVIPVRAGRLEPSENDSDSTEQHTGKAENRGITETSHIGHCNKLREVLM
jgi:hypothetical protein